MDASDVGSLGTLSLIRRLPMESVVTSYPIDDEELTIGRDQSCLLRLYYPAVSPLHAKVTFVERKAFLVVLGTNGVLLDDEPLFPAATTAPGPTTVPLQNNSVIEIHNKRFRFTYPPKHLRPALINTPTRNTPAGTRRPLRLSMIASAHVFTPRPSSNPLENLRVLQTPLRTPFAPEEEEIVLVQSSTPRVVEEDKDLVIIDEVEPAPVFLLPVPVLPKYPVTPVRRPRPSLHRAVLIRSAQRAVMQREIQLEEEQDEEEVEETIAAIPEEGDDDVQEIPQSESHREVSGWRKSLDMVKGSLGWALRGLSVEPKEEDQEPEFGTEDLEAVPEQPEEMEDEDGEDNGEYDEAGEQVNDHTLAVDPPRPLGQFMTPQISRIASKPRLSLGGAALDAGPRRIRVVTPWKVGEIQVPAAIKEECHEAPAGSTPAPPSTPRSPVKKEKLTDEEREAIRARRRSAAATPDNFFKGQTPGSRRTLFPSIAPLPSPSFSVPSDVSPASSTSQVSPQEVSSSSSSAEVDAKEDTAVLLARMKQMVEGVKQRQSLGRQSLNPSPRKRDNGFSLLAPNHASALRPSRILIEEDDGDAMQDEEGNHGQSGAHVRATDQQTSYMSDLHHTLGPLKLETSPPALPGVHEMFSAPPRGLIETPRMDGIQEMFTTPMEYRVQLPPLGIDEEEHDEPVAELPVRPARGKRTPATKTSRRTPVPQSAPPKSTRAASQPLEAPETSAGARRTRARTADGTVGQIPRATRKTTKPMTPEPKETESDMEAHPAPAATRGARRTRQATDASTSSHTEDNKPARRTRAKTPTLAVGTSTAKTGTTRRGTRAKPIEVTEEEPDDSLAPVPRTRRGGRSKVQMKEEDVEESVPAGENDTETRTTRARRTPVPRLPVPVATARGGTRPRAAAVAVESTIPENKENAPDPSDDGEDPKTVGAKPRGGRTTRGAAKASGRSAIADAGEDLEVDASTAPAPKIRRTRATKA